MSNRTDNLKVCLVIGAIVLLLGFLALLFSVLLP